MKKLIHILSIVLFFLLGGIYIVSASQLVSPEGIYAGIGTSTPAFILQIASSTNSSSFRPQLVLSDTSTSTNKHHWYLSSDKGSFNIGTTSDAYATSSPRLMIASSGNTGLGTTSPSEKLDVNGSINVEGSTNGIILHDSVTSNCYILQVVSGVVTATSHACQ